MRRLDEKGIGCRPFFCPMHRQPVFRNMGLFRDEDYPIADRLYKKGFYIPSGLALNEAQLDSVAAAVWDVLG